ncbi:MAG: 16S rRNA (cytosine(1402)-N(4))-methyltransferase RsmH [Patescibacteria group bacterium]
MVHKTVLLHESIEGLSLKKGSIYVDGTLGSGGHSKLAFDTLEGDITIVAFDQDQNAIERSKTILGEGKNIHYVLNNYRNLDSALDSLGIKEVDAVMLDLGLSSDQFEVSGRGFTFRKDEPLLMTFAESTSGKLTAHEIVNSWPEEELARIIFEYGEESFSRKIAKAITVVRKLAPIETTFGLVEVIKNATPGWYHHRRIHYATKTFQALRIATNDELGSLKEGLEKGFNRLKKDGRMAIISFHSLEDRIVKHAYRAYSDEGKGILITKRPICPSDTEVEENPRSRSAKLRIIQKV